MDPSAATNHRSRGSLSALASGEVSGSGSGGTSKATPVTCPAEGGKAKAPRAASSKVTPPLALRQYRDPDGTKAFKMTAARRLYDDRSSRRVVCGMQRAGTPNVYLRLKQVVSRPCTPTECNCVIDYETMAAQMGLYARYGDGPLRPDADYVRQPAPLSLWALRPSPPHPSQLKRPFKQRAPKQHGAMPDTRARVSQVSNTIRKARKTLHDQFSAAAAAEAAEPKSSRPALAHMDVNTSPERNSPKRKTPEQRKKTPRGEEDDDASGSSGKRMCSSDGAYPNVRLVSAFTDC